MAELPLISLLTLTPLIGAALVAGLEPEKKSLARGLGLGFMLASLGWFALLWLNFDSKSGGLQFEKHYPWVPSLNIEYFVAMDGLGLLMVLLTALVVPFAL